MKLIRTYIKHVQTYTKLINTYIKQLQTYTKHIKTYTTHINTYIKTYTRQTESACLSRSTTTIPLNRVLWGRAYGRRTDKQTRQAVLALPQR